MTADSSPSAQIDNVFAPYLIHQLDVIKEQSENGLYVVKRVSAFLKKIASNVKQTSQATIKACQHEMVKERARKDAMNLHVQAYLRIQDAYLQQANAQSEFADAVLSDVVEPLTTCFKEGEKRRLELVVKHQKLNNKLEVVTSNVSKARSACVKLWKEVQLADQAMKKEANKNSKKLPKAEKAFRALQQKAVKSFQSFEQLLATAIADQKRHWEVELPELTEDFERLEVGRMTTLKTLLSVFAQLQTQIREPLEACIDTGFEVSDALAPRQELAEFVREQVQVHQLPPRVPAFKVLLPCSSAAIEAGSAEFFAALNLDSEQASQQRQELLDAQELITVNLPEPRELEIDGVVLLSGGVGGSGSSASASGAASADKRKASRGKRPSTSRSSGSAAPQTGSDSDTGAAELSQFLREDSDSGDDASDRLRTGSVSVAVKKAKKEKKSKKPKKDKEGKSDKKAKKHRKLKSSGDEGAQAAGATAEAEADEAKEQPSGSGGAAAESEAAAESGEDGQPSPAATRTMAAEDDDDDSEDTSEVFDLRAALKEDKKASPLLLVFSNFDFQPGDQAEDDKEVDSDNEDLAFNKGDWLRVTHKQQHDSDEEDSEDEDAGDQGGNGADMWWRGFHCRLHGASERGIFPSNYVSVTTITQDNPSLHVWLQRPSAMFAFAWAASKFGSVHVVQFVALWNDIELFRKLECRHLRDKEEEIDHSNLVLQGQKILHDYLRPIAEGASKWQLKSAGPIVAAVDTHGDQAIEPRMFDPCAKEMAQLLSKGFELVRKRHPDILLQLSTVYSKTGKA